jgi:4-amino-4-deoxy-L-arabinose transferase-like glycosyltransferase
MDSKDPWRSFFACGGLLFLLFARLIWGSLSISATADEPSHLASGYAWLARGQNALWTIPERGHPLLVDAWLALPIFVARPDIPLEDLDGWREDYALFVRSFQTYLNPLQRSLLAGRVPEMLLTLFLAAVVYRWGRDLWGMRGGLLALAALVFDPTLVAHGRLATNDLGVVAGGTFALYVAWRWWRRPSWRYAVVLGGSIAATMLAKQSGILWAAAIGLGTMYIGIAERRPWRYWGGFLVVGVVAFLLLWAAYGFTFGPVPALSISLPAPVHWRGILQNKTGAEQRLVYALGMRTRGRWWWYFPLAFLIKNPLSLLLAVGISAGVLFRRPAVPDRVCALGIFSLLYTVVAAAVGMNTGYRHMLPVQAVLYLFVGGGISRWVWIKRPAFWRKGLAGALGVWYIAGTVWIFPYEISYFNELVGGPSNGYRYLSDSNVDWGQSIYVREAYLSLHPGVQTEPPASKFRPSAGRYMIPASYWQGLGLGDPSVYEWFRHLEPDAVLNYSTLIYDVQPLAVGWFAQCETPRLRLERDAIIQGTGYQDLRIVRFDCTQAWIYPGGDPVAVIYALHRDLIGDAGVCFPSMLPCPDASGDPFVAEHLAQARLSFEQARTAQSPPFVLYESLPGGVKYPSDSPAYALGSGTSPVELDALAPLAKPITLNGTMSFLGAVTYVGRDTWNVETWWHVEQGPVSRPFSIMGHLLSSDGETVGMYDKLGVSPLALRAGDVVVQRHLFAMPPGGMDLWLRTGAYWLDTMERWPVDSVPGSDALLVHLGTSE